MRRRSRLVAMGSIKPRFANAAPSDGRFRLDRLQAPRATGARFRPRELPADDAAAFVRSGIEHAPWNHEVEALIEAPAATVRDRIGRWVTVEEVDDRRCRLRMTTDSLDWALLALGATGADFAVIGPPELRDRVRDWGERFARASGAA